jgi:hypothetical protein
MIPRRSGGALILLLLGCAGERETGPLTEARIHSLDPRLATLLTQSGIHGPVAVLERLDRPDHHQIAFAGGRRFEVGVTRPNRSGLALDVQEGDALFIVNPRGPRMLRADSSVMTGWQVLCIQVTPQGTQIFRSLNATINSIANRAIDSTGGHLHTNGTKPTGGWTPNSGPLDANAEFVTKYISQIASGDERLTLKYTPHDTPCAGIFDSVTFTTATRVRNLVNMGSYTHMYFDDAAHAGHDQIFWIRAAVEAQVHQVADEYYRQSAQTTGAQDSLKITSVSLKFGGLYDFHNDWALPHETHKLGTDVDMNGRTNTSPQQHQVLKRLGEAAGSRRCDPHPTNEPVKTHVHCYFGPPYGPTGQ